MNSQNTFAILSDDYVAPPTPQPSPQPKLQRKAKQPRKNKPYQVDNSPTNQCVIEQFNLCNKYKYEYKVLSNGNVENNSTLYVRTGVAHPHQVEELFKDVVERAKKMTDVFGKGFECDVQINVVRKRDQVHGTGKEVYTGHAFVDLTNPKLYYALTGRNIDGTERARYVDDPNWNPPEESDDEEDLDMSKLSWADMSEQEDKKRERLVHPKIREEFPPLLILNEYRYDQQQQNHLQTDEKYGSISVSPAFINPGVNSEHDDCCLYVNKVPADDLKFLYAIFSRYARYYKGHTQSFFPKIMIRVSNRGERYAIVQYAHHFDAAFALSMLQKIRAKYNGEDVIMPVRYAYKDHV